jgi:L-asparaginase
MIHSKDGNELRPGNIEDFRHLLPEINTLPCEIEYKSLAEPVDSSKMKPKDWVDLARLIEENYEAFDGFVVLHGTDTMAFTASALSFMLENLGKPVILTGSVLPIDLVRSDGRENFVNALEIASRAEHPLPEVAICFDAKLYRGNRSIKYSSQKFQAFISPNYPTLAEAGFEIEYYTDNWMPPPVGDFRIHTEMREEIVMLKFFPGLNEQFLEAILNIDGLRAVVIETYGNGNLPDFPWLIKSLERAVERGINIINVTQCTAGKVTLGKYETSKQLKDIGVISGQDLTSAAAITKLMYLYGKYDDDLDQVLQLFNRSISGEMSHPEEQERLNLPRLQGYLY